MCFCICVIFRRAHLFNEYQGFFPQDVKLPDSPSSSTEVKNEWIYIPTPRIRLHGVVLNEAMDTTS